MSNTNKMNTDSPLDEMDQKEFERLIGDVIHKVKNNLGGISGFATLLARDVGEDSPHIRMIEQIQTSVLRLDDLAVDLMVFIRKPKIKSEEVNIRPLVTHVIHQYEERSRFKCKIVCGNAKSTAPLLCKTDSFVMERILLYIVRFAEHARGILKQMTIDTDASGLLKIEAQMTQIDLDYCRTLQVKELITQYEPVEARLAFAILIKLIRSLGGEVSLTSEHQTDLNMVIEIA